MNCARVVQYHRPKMKYKLPQTVIDNDNGLILYIYRNPTKISGLNPLISVVYEFFLHRIHGHKRSLTQQNQDFPTFFL